MKKRETNRHCLICALVGFAVGTAISMALTGQWFSLTCMLLATGGGAFLYLSYLVFTDKE